MILAIIISVLTPRVVPGNSDRLPRVRRSLSCRLGEGGCKWSCRLRGYMRGSCDQASQCQCHERLSATALMRHFSHKWSHKFPDLGIISDMMEDILKRNDSTCDKSNSDGKWRPFPLLLGALFKAQEDVIMDELDDSEINEDELMSLLGHYWHLIIAADTILRSGLRDGETEAAVKSILEENKRNYAERIGVRLEDVVWVWSAELDRSRDHVAQHVPDHVVTTHHSERLVILTLLGTRVWPDPQPLDIMMDLMATARPYLGGLAHSGLAQGAANIVSTAVPAIRAELDKHPGYEVLIIGYSLGAGLAQLVALDCEVGVCKELLPSGAVIRAVGFGSPPVFTPAEDEKDMEAFRFVPQLDNVFLVSNREDGISGVSLNNIYDVFHQLCLVDNLNIRRRDLLRLLFSDPDEEGKDYIELVDQMDSVEEERYGVEIINFQNEDLPDGDNTVLSSIRHSVSNATAVTDQPELYHLASTLLVIRRTDPDIKSFSISDHHGIWETMRFTNYLHLSPSMLTDHFPQGGYNDLFSNIGDFSRGTNHHYKVSVLDNLIKQNHSLQDPTKPGKWGRFKTNIKNFFKGIG